MSVDLQPGSNVTLLYAAAVPPVFARGSVAKLEGNELVLALESSGASRSTTSRGRGTGTRCCSSSASLPTYAPFARSPASCASRRSRSTSVDDTTRPAAATHRIAVVFEQIEEEGAEALIRYTARIQDAFIKGTP